MFNCHVPCVLNALVESEGVERCTRDNGELLIFVAYIKVKTAYLLMAYVKSVARYEAGDGMWRHCKHNSHGKRGSVSLDNVKAVGLKH